MSVWYQFIKNYMNNLSDILFIERFPSLDLHGFSGDIAVVAVNDFILDNLKLKNDIIVIVHGIGNGILKSRVHEALRRNKNVLQYATYYNNNGCTIVRLKIWQKAYFMVLFIDNKEIWHQEKWIRIHLIWQIKKTMLL